MRFFSDRNYLVIYDDCHFCFRLFKASNNIIQVISENPQDDSSFNALSEHECSTKEFVSFCNHLDGHSSANLLNIDWLLTSRCNLKCVYCYADDINGAVAIEDAFRICDQINASSVLHVNLSGGEPLLYPEIDQIISRLDSNISITVDTNGTFPEIIEKHVSVFKKQNVSFRVTIDSMDQAILSELRPPRFAFDPIEKIDQTLFLLKANNFNVMVHTVVSSKNKNSLSSLAEYLIKKGIARWNLNKVIVNGDSDLKKLAIKDRSFLSITRKIVREYGDKIGVVSTCVPFNRSVIIIMPTGTMYTHNYLTGQRMPINASLVKPNSLFDYLDRKNHYLEYFRQYNDKTE